MAVTLLAVLFFVYLIFAFRRQLLELWRLNRLCQQTLEKIPGPPSIPILGAAHLFKWNNQDFSEQLENWGREHLLNNNSYYGLMKVWVGPVPLVFCGLHESIRPILESTTNISKPNQYDIISEWIGTGLLTSTNAKWHRRRKLLTPTFHFNILQGYHDVFVRQGEILADVVAKEEGFFDLFPYIKRCALDIICETAMGTSIHSQTGGNNEYVQAVQKLSAIIWDYERFPWLWLKPIWYLSGIGFEFNRLVNLTNDFTRKVIADRKRAMEEDGLIAGNGGDPKKEKLAFLDLLLRMQHESQLSDEDIREEVDTFMFEGHDTTSSGIGFTIWWLGQSPEAQIKVHEELDNLFGDSDRLPTPDDLKQMVYLEKCVKEALRLTPSVPLIARKLAEDVTIGETKLPEGLTVVVVPVTTARDPRYWERPEDFYPEHFDAEKVAARNPYSYIPFSAGPRNCIGQKFAVLEEKAVLSWIFRRYKVESEEPFPANRPLPEIILKPSNGFRVRLTKR
ncbi:hypothetical protein Q1695_002481 [Nippostrongylus brasiliensis]|nr:hypothetical protein Q1695_002481 [Nippostrongylus brasiliensis]